MKLTTILSEIFFPRCCLGCGISITTGAVCRACFTGIAVGSAFFCGECGGRLPIAMKVCHPLAPCLIGAAGPYQNAALKALIHHLKFRNAREAAEPLAELLATFVLAAMPRMKGYLVVPIPLSRQRYLERGYNQAALIAAQLATKLSLPLAPPDVLLKTKHTKPQVETGNLQERQENLSGCFTVGGSAGAAAVAGKKILLIDDVTTSGSTFVEAAKVLRAAGATRIIAVAVAKA